METLESAKVVYAIALQLDRNNKPYYLSVGRSPIACRCFKFIDIHDATQVTTLDAYFEHNGKCVEWYVEEIVCAERLKTLLPDYILNPNHEPISLKQIRRFFRAIYTGRVS